jgi:hypothetical protein
MTERHEFLSHDLVALRYLDAVNAGDLETVAALWDQASRDPQLGRILGELDQELFFEESGSRAKGSSSRGPRRAVAGHRASLFAALVAACLVGMAVWFARSRPLPAPAAPQPRSVITDNAKLSPRDDDGQFAAWRQYRRVLEGGEMPAFDWPLQGDSSRLGIKLGSTQPSSFPERNGRL